MEAALDLFSVEIPKKDTAFFKFLANKLGWITKEAPVSSKPVARTDTKAKHYAIDDIAGIIPQEKYDGEYLDGYIKDKYGI